MYADFDAWVALLTSDDEATASLFEAHGDELEVSLVTFVQLFRLEEEYPFDRDRAITAILTLADYDGDPDVLYRASAYRDDGLDTFQAFHAAMGESSLLSSSPAYDDVGVQRVWTE